MYGTYTVPVGIRYYYKRDTFTSLTVTCVGSVGSGRTLLRKVMLSVVSLSALAFRAGPTMMPHTIVNPTFPTVSQLRCSAPANEFNAYKALEAADPVIRVSDGKSIVLTSEWGQSERAVLVFFRSFG